MGLCEKQILPGLLMIIENQTNYIRYIDKLEMVAGRRFRIMITFLIL